MNRLSTSIPNVANDPSLGTLDAEYAVLPQAASAAVAIAPGLYPITKSGVAALTLAAPTAGLPSAGGHDGYTMTFMDTGGHAHTITTPASGINGSLHVATFGGSVPQFCTMRAYGGVWYVLQSSGVTLS
jgi:hypothetical protein